MVLTGFIKPQTHVALELKPVGLTGSGETRSRVAQCLLAAAEVAGLHCVLTDMLPHLQVRYRSL
jgi:hypothetical protein